MKLSPFCQPFSFFVYDEEQHIKLISLLDEYGMTIGQGRDFIK